MVLNKSKLSLNSPRDLDRTSCIEIIVKIGDER